MNELRCHEWTHKKKKNLRVMENLIRIELLGSLRHKNPVKSLIQRETVHGIKTIKFVIICRSGEIIDSAVYFFYAAKVIQVVPDLHSSANLTQSLNSAMKEYSEMVIGFNGVPW